MIGWGRIYIGSLPELGINVDVLLTTGRVRAIQVQSFVGGRSTIGALNLNRRGEDVLRTIIGGRIGLMD